MGSRARGDKHHGLDVPLLFRTDMALACNDSRGFLSASNISAANVEIIYLRVHSSYVQGVNRNQ